MPYNILAKRASLLDGRGKDSKPCRVQRAGAVSYQSHPFTQSTVPQMSCRWHLHGICGEKDPIEDDDYKRVYEGGAVDIAADSNEKAK